MAEVNLMFEVHIKRPDSDIYKQLIQDWIEESTTVLPKYRIYVDDDLIVERSWMWHSGTFLQENIWVNLDHGSHIFKLQSRLNWNSVSKFNFERVQFYQFSIQYLLINNSSSTVDDPILNDHGREIEVSFLL